MKILLRGNILHFDKFSIFVLTKAEDFNIINIG